MTIDQIREYHQARPFVPFVLNLADGRQVRVDHPEFMAQSPGGRIVHVAKGEHSIESIDLLLVVSVERATGGPQNGRKRKSA